MYNSNLCKNTRDNMLRHSGETAASPKRIKIPPDKEKTECRMFRMKNNNFPLNRRLHIESELCRSVKLKYETREVQTLSESSPLVPHIVESTRLLSGRNLPQEQGECSQPGEVRCMMFCTAHLLQLKLDTRESQTMERRDARNGPSRSSRTPLLTLATRSMYHLWKEKRTCKFCTKFKS